MKEIYSISYLCSEHNFKYNLPCKYNATLFKEFVKYRENHQDGSNEFIYSRFLSPYLMNFKGWVLYLDGDMVCLADLKELWDLRDKKYAVQVVKHKYKTSMKKKYFGNVNENYPRRIDQCYIMEL